MGEALESEITYGVMKGTDKKPLLWFDSYEKAEKYARFANLNEPCSIIKRVKSYSVAAIVGFYVENTENTDEN